MYFNNLKVFCEIMAKWSYDGNVMWLRRLQKMKILSAFNDIVIPFLTQHKLPNFANYQDIY